MNLSRHKKNAGFTLVEVAIVLLIVGLIVAGIWIALGSTIKEKKLSDSRRQITEIVNNTRDYFSGRDTRISTTGNPGDPIVQSWGGMEDNPFTARIQPQAQIFPNDTPCTGSVRMSCANPYSGAYTLQLYSDTAAVGGGKFLLKVMTSNLPQDACINLGVSFGGAATQNQQQTGFVGLASGGNADRVDLFPPIAPNNANLAQKCSGNANRLWFVFRI